MRNPGLGFEAPKMFLKIWDTSVSFGVPRKSKEQSANVGLDLAADLASALRGSEDLAAVPHPCRQASTLVQSR